MYNSALYESAFKNILMPSQYNTYIHIQLRILTLFKEEYVCYCCFLYDLKDYPWKIYRRSLCYIVPYAVYLVVNYSFHSIVGF